MVSGVFVGAGTCWKVPYSAGLMYRNMNNFLCAHLQQSTILFLLFSVLERITAETLKNKNKTALTHSDDVSLTERSAAAFKSNQVKLTIY